MNDPMSMVEPNSAYTVFWTKRWEAGKIPWDLGGIPPQLVKPGGRLVGMFLYGQEPELPPFPLASETAAGLLGQSFRLLADESVTQSVPVYQGMERWQEWERIA